MTYQVFQNGTALTAEVMNDVIMEQAVPTFVNASERDNAIPAPNQGQHCHLLSTHRTYYYNSGWVALRDDGHDVLTKAPMVGSWRGEVYWLKNGRSVTVDIAVAYGGTLNLAAWTGSDVAAGLPTPLIGGGASKGFVTTNQAEYGAWQWGVGGDTLRFGARWQARTFNDGGWAQGSFSYISAA